MTRVSMRILVGVCMMAGLCLPAAAQLSQSGGATQIDADRLEVDDRENKTTFVGNVDVIQGDVRLRADKLTVFFPASGTGDAGVSSGLGGDPERMVAVGDVFYNTTDIQARGDTGVYVNATDTVTLTGNVILSRGEDNIAQGECLTLHIDTGQSTLGCGTVADNEECRANPGSEKCRVRVILSSEEVKAEPAPNAQEPDEDDGAEEE